MMYVRRPLLLLTCIAGLGFASVVAANDEPARAKNMQVSGDAVHFSYPHARGLLTLKVAGPGDLFFTASFDSGQTPSLSLFDSSGHALPDGQYSWEMGAKPRLGRAAENALDAARRESGGADGSSRAPVITPTSSVSGYFRVLNGRFVDPEVREPGSETSESTRAITNKDSVVLDDQIVQGSICAGLDCSNGESFGFDTIRIKENNLRIKAQDTSTSASFPTRDWELTFNDSENGGANRFSVTDVDAGRAPFTIEAGAPANALYVSDGGEVGFGTQTPVVEVHVQDGNSPTMRLEQDASNGFTPQTWDVAGNEANFFVRDVTNGSELPFKIKPGAPTGTLFLAADGKVGIGTESPSGQLTLQANGKVDLDLTSTASGGNSWRIRSHHVTGQLNFIDNTNSKAPFKMLPAANSSLLVIGGTPTLTPDADQVSINGNLVVNGTITPDYVFEPDYPLLPLEEQAAYMWENKHLPAVGGAVIENGQHKIDVARRADGVLEELEKAHIYIDQLHSMIKDLSQRIEKLEGQP